MLGYAGPVNSHKEENSESKISELSSRNASRDWNEIDVACFLKINNI